MARTVPKHVIRKIDRMNRLMGEIVSLNFELEEWLEKNGVEDGFAFTSDYRDDRGYAIHWPDDFVAAIEAELEQQ